MSEMLEKKICGLAAACKGPEASRSRGGGDHGSKLGNEKWSAIR